MNVMRSVCLLLPALALAQTPPPEVDAALRARVTEFCNYHVQGKFTKAWGLVSEDSKEMYFNSNKTQFESFNGITKIEYNDDFTKAKVSYSYDRMWEIRMQKHRVTEQTMETWKVEDGKWVWYYNPKDHWCTPMGPCAPQEGAKPGLPGIPANLTEAQLRKRADELMKRPTSIDKQEVTFSTERSGLEVIKLHNGAPGSVMVEVDRGKPLPGFGVELDSPTLDMNKDAVLTLTYKPQTKDVPEPKTIRVTVQPFNQIFEIKVRFAETPKAD